MKPILSSIIRKNAFRACFIAVVLMFAACEEFCEDPNRTAVVIAFFQITDGEETPLAGHSITVNCAGNDSIIYTATSAAQIMLPVNPNADSIRFSLKNGEQIADTITIRYVRHNGFVSPECGCVTHAEIQEVSQATTHAVDSIKVVSPHAGTVSYRQSIVNAENIRIYY